MKLKTIQDYYELICAKYPKLNPRDIKRILQFGWKSFYLHNSYGGDVAILLRDLAFYSGCLMKDSIRWFTYYKRKMKVKLRVMYKRKKIEWDGYYYFARNKAQYEAYLAKKNRKVGRPTKKFTFEHVFAYKIFDECNIIESGAYAIFRIPYAWNRGFKFYEPKLVTDEAELVIERNPLKFKEILLSEYNYEFISDQARKNKKK